MQTKNLLSVVLIVTIGAFFTSCKQSNQQGRLVPKNASVVMHMDGKAMAAKLPWDEIKKNVLFQEAYSDTGLPAGIKSLLDNPENSGIDVAGDLVFFAVKDSIGGYVAFEGSVKDAEKFKAFNTQMTENGASSEKGDIQFISKFPVCVGWTKDKFIYVVDAPQMAQMDDLSKRMMRDSITLPTVSGRDIGTLCKTMFELPESSSLGKEEKFTKLMKEKGDLHFWLNAEELYKNAASASALAMLNMDKLYKGNVTTGTVDFDNGKIAVKSTSYASEEITNLFKKYGGGKVDEDMIKRMPGKDVIAVMALNFKPEGIRELIKLTNLDGLLNIGLNSLGFTIDDFIKANKGDIFFGLSDFSMKTDTALFDPNKQTHGMVPGQKTDFNFIFSAAIGDKDAFNKLVSAGQKVGGQAMGGDSSKFPISYNMNGKYFVLSNSKENTDKFLGGTTGDFDFVSKITGEPFGGYLNIQSLLKAVPAGITSDSTGKVVMAESLKFWNDVLWKGGNYNDGGITQTIEVNLVDKTTNSLKQLNQYIAKLGLLYKEKKKRDIDDWKKYEDSVIPADTTNQ